MYYRGATAIILAYDITDKSSLDDLALRMVDLCENGPQHVVLAVVGCKADLKQGRAVSKEMVDEFVASFPDKYKEVVVRECSSKTGQGVQELFEEICRQIEALRRVLENGNDW